MEPLVILLKFVTFAGIIFYIIISYQSAKHSVDPGKQSDHEMMRKFLISLFFTPAVVINWFRWLRRDLRSKEKITRREMYVWAAFAVVISGLTFHVVASLTRTTPALANAYNQHSDLCASLKEAVDQQKAIGALESNKSQTLSIEEQMSKTMKCR